MESQETGCNSCHETEKMRLNERLREVREDESQIRTVDLGYKNINFPRGQIVTSESSL